VTPDEEERRADELDVMPIGAVLSRPADTRDLRVWIATYEATHGIGWMLVDPGKGAEAWEWAAGYEIPDDAVRLDRPGPVRP
jgi:hypothetical protein